MCIRKHFTMTEDKVLQKQQYRKVIWLGAFRFSRTLFLGKSVAKRLGNVATKFEWLKTMRR